MEIEAADPAPDSPARRVLLKQERLIEAQTSQLGRQRWRDFIVTALGVTVLAGAGLLVWDASQADGVVVEPFAVPQDMVERGLTGPVVATQLLDRLTHMQARTESLRAASTYADDWGGDIEVEIPNTGVSIGEVRRYLRAWLGHQTRLSGEVFRLADGRVAVTMRVGSKPGSRVEGTEAELDALLQQGAEAIYGETQPYRYAVWLGRENRRAEAEAILRTLSTGRNVDDRLWGYNGLAIYADSPAETRRYHLAALRLRPGFVPALNNLANSMTATGRDEEAYHRFGEVLANAAAARRELEPGRAEAVLSGARSSRASYEGDMRRAAELAEERIGMPAAAGNVAMSPMLAALSYAAARDMPAARRVLEENGYASPQAVLESLVAFGPLMEIESAFFFAIGDMEAARDRLILALNDYADYAETDRDPAQTNALALSQAMLATLHASLGEITKARSAIASTDLDCVPCVRARGLIEAYAGNPRGADHWLSEAVRLSPSLPAAHLDWSEAYLVRRDPAGAVVQARLAVQKGPRWADPRKLWGDALMMQNKPAEAARKYREAIRMAPNWGGLHLALGRAEAAAGRRETAERSFRSAAALELSPADRAAVTTLLR